MTVIHNFANFRDFNLPWDRWTSCSVSFSWMLHNPCVVKQHHLKVLKKTAAVGKSWADGELRPSLVRNYVNAHCAKGSFVVSSFGRLYNRNCFFNAHHKNAVASPHYDLSQKKCSRCSRMESLLSMSPWADTRSLEGTEAHSIYILQIYWKVCYCKFTINDYK